jgi:hypothetical protein
MRLIAAAIACIALSPFAAAFAADQAADPAATAPAAAAAPSDAAAAKHAKRTACRQEATDRKLTGKDKKAYVKDCMTK